MLGASVLVVASAVYLGFIHSNDSVEGTPIAVSGKVKTQNAEPPLAVAQRSAPVFVAQRPVRPAPVRTPLPRHRRLRCRRQAAR